MISSGKLDRKVTLLRATTTANALNEPVETFASIGVAWASMRRASAREVLASAEIGAESTTVFEFRYLTGPASLTPKDRLSYGGREFNIQSVEEIGRREGVRVGAVARAE